MLYREVEEKIKDHSTQLDTTMNKASFIDKMKLKFIYGAKLDGVSDDIIPLQNMYDDISSKGGGDMILPDGVTICLSQPFIIYNNKVNIKGGGNLTILKAIKEMKSVIQVNKLESTESIMKIMIEDLTINGNNFSQDGIYSKNVGMLSLKNIISRFNIRAGIYLDSNTWMFDMYKTYTTHNGQYGVYIGDECAGSGGRFVISEENPLNLRIGYSRMVSFRESTFQRFTILGNVLIQSGWDITLDNCWFEAPLNVVNGETYDIKNESSYNGNIGHNIRIINNSFHGNWGENGKTKHCIIDNYTDTYLANNYIDGSNGYTSDKWYINSNQETNVIGINNQVSGGKGFTLQSYSMWHTNVGGGDSNNIWFNQIRIASKLSMPEIPDMPYDYDGRIQNSSSYHTLRISAQGRWWYMKKVFFSPTMPVNGSWIANDYVENNAKKELGSVGSKYVIKGWLRVTTGSNNVNGVDWLEDRGTTGN